MNIQFLRQLSVVHKFYIQKNIFDSMSKGKSKKTSKRVVISVSINTFIARNKNAIVLGESVCWCLCVCDSEYQSIEKVCATLNGIHNS